MESAYDPHTLEQSLYAHWEQSGYFQPVGTGDPYCIMIPPPNVTGSLHMGHGFNNTIMDALIRYQRMRGRQTLWQPGTDHAGIATQMVVERQLASAGLSRHAMGRDAFLQRIWEWKATSGGTITQQIRRLGSSVDWSRERFTMDEGLSAAVREAFVRLHEEGLIYRGKRLVNWDPGLLTAISDLEVESVEIQGSLWHLRYPLADASGALTVATTRPETMLGDVAVAVHPEDTRYQRFIGQLLRLPLTGRLIPVIADALVDPAFGTGCVKITPAHDFNDYDMGQRHQLPLINILDQHAHILPAFECFTWQGQAQGQEPAPESLAGLERMQARKTLLSLAEAAGWLVHTEAHVLKVPKGDRSQVIVEPWLTDQWYVRTAPMAQVALRAVEEGRIRFVPSSYQNMYFAWMRDIKDWCISRQLWWGHRIPAWYDDAGHVWVGHDEASVRQRYQLPDTLSLRQDPDVLDTWFSSGLWTFSTLGWPESTPELQKFHPTQVLVTGFDIIFFWVTRMIMFGMHFLRDADGRPQVHFEVVYVHGLVRDSEGQKMSKSKGNVLDPLDFIDGIDLPTLIAKRTQNLMRPQDALRIEKATHRDYPEGIAAYGTDALRFTFAALASTGRDIRFDLKRVEGYRNFCNKIWNASRFILTHLQQRQPDVAMAPPNAADSWISAQIHFLCERTEQCFNEFRFDLLAQSLYEFFWNDLCDWYLELCKPLLVDTNEPQRQRTLYTLSKVLDTALRLLHPIMPFITESIWLRLRPWLDPQTPASLMLAPWPTALDWPVDALAQAQISWLRSILTALRTLRSELQLNPGQAIPLWLRKGTPEDHQRIDACMQWISVIARISSLQWQDEDTGQATATAVVGVLELHIPLAGLIDIHAETQRLEKTLMKLDQEIQRLQEKLGSATFTAKAPAAVVAKEQAKLTDYQQQKQPLYHQLQRLRHT